jgi:hypothetical protein
MLTFAEAILKELRSLQSDTEQMILGGVADMERYRFLMGRLEGLKLAVDSVKELVKKFNPDDD